MTEANKEVARASAPVNRRRPARHWTLVCAAVLAFGLAVERSAAGHRGHEDRDIWFVHATDPHLFIPPGKEGRDEQQKQNQQALSDLFKWIGSLPDGYGSPAFLVLTGDLGVDPCDIRQASAQSGTPAPTPTPTAQRNAEPAPETDEATKEETLSVDDCLKVKRAQHDDQINVTARILGESPVQDIYLVAGNNDIATESAGDPALKYFSDFIQDVQKELIKNKRSVRLHNLTHCYISGEASGSCYADIPHSAYRLIGFPSYSFKSSEEKAQRAQFEKFRQLLDDSRKQGMKALVITHTPKMDDPFALAQQRYVNPKATTAALSVPTPAPAAPTATPAPSEMATPAETSTPAGTATPAPKTKKAQTQTDKSSFVTTWKVNEQLLDDWQDAITSESIVGVFAGHLHDSHKEIYRRPYAWSSGSPAAFRKLFLAPPLALKNQDTSPIQARGFSLVHLQPDRLESRLFWYDSETRAFTPDSKPKSKCERHHSRRNLCQDSRAAIRWLWNLDTGKALERMAVLLIAFLTAFLTIVAIWQIPPGVDPFADVKKTEGESKPAQAGATNGSSDSSPFSNKLGKTVIAGLAGLVAAEVTKTLGNEKPSPDLRWYYIVWFILFFFLLLLSLNLWRAAVEALRSRVAVVYYPARKGGDVTAWDVFRHWLSSLRVPLLTFSDTFVNLIQGKNQTRTRVFEDRIIDQQRTLLRVADAIRTNLNRLIDRTVQQERHPSGNQSDQFDRVRVNISVLSRDQTNVFYVSRAPGSSHSTFQKRSVAWVSVFTGQPFWYLSEYRKDEEGFYNKVILFEKEGTIPDERGPYRLQDYFQPRPQADYQAFMIIPVPLPRRGFGSDYVKGAIQISFKQDADLKTIWEKSDEMRPKPNPSGGPPIYPAAPPILEDWCPHADIRAALNNSVAALGELLRGFNEIIYKNYIESDQPN